MSYLIRSFSWGVGRQGCGEVLAMSNELEGFSRFSLLHYDYGIKDHIGTNGTPLDAI